MDEHLISKKELLARYGISYGALYRWKRMGLIPEEWFQKKSTVTGQETYFYREQICERIEMILARGNSLEALAEELSKGTQPAPRRELVISDRFSTRRFFLEELTAVQIVDGTQEKDLLDTLKGVQL